MFSFEMAQRLKQHVRAGIVAAACALFAETGYEQTTMAAVASRAGTSIGNVYKYFAGKEQLFDAVVPAEFARALKRMTRQRIGALGTARDVRELAPDARYHVLAGELLDYSLLHRERVVILLGRPEGTPFASFAEDFASRLVAWALAYARHAWPRVEPSAGMRFALGRIYRSYLASLAQALQTFRSDDRAREAVGHLTAHHLGGLKHLFEMSDTVRAGAT
jgi:AcrR family transcriptional regulator